MARTLWLTVTVRSPGATPVTVTGVVPWGRPSMLTAAPRGTLSHWIVIKDRKIRNYQVVVPSTWNASPRDPKDVPGPYEAALMDNHPLHDPEQPIEILRTIHSFDPCLACAVHTIDVEGNEIGRIKVL